MRKFIDKHLTLWTQREFLVSVLIGLLILAVGLTATNFANHYATLRASNWVTDIILDNIPVVNVSFLYSQGALLFLVIVALILILEPKRVPFVLKSLGLFFIVRSIFMTLTHIAAPPQMSVLNYTDLINRLSSGDDLFFSAHTGLPFLLALVFWNEKYLRYLFILATLAGGTIVLLGHLHYSIDVFSAFFISFGIYHMAMFLFKKEYKLMRG